MAKAQIRKLDDGKYEGRLVLPLYRAAEPLRFSLLYQQINPEQMEVFIKEHGYKLPNPNLKKGEQTHGMWPITQQQWESVGQDFIEGMSEYVSISAKVPNAKSYTHALHGLPSLLLAEPFVLGEGFGPFLGIPSEVITVFFDHFLESKEANLRLLSELRELEQAIRNQD